MKLFLLLRIWNWINLIFQIGSQIYRRMLDFCKNFLISCFLLNFWLNISYGWSPIWLHPSQNWCQTNLKNCFSNLKKRFHIVMVVGALDFHVWCCVDLDLGNLWWWWVLDLVMMVGFWSFSLYPTTGIIIIASCVSKHAWWEIDPSLVVWDFFCLGRW